MPYHLDWLVPQRVYYTYWWDEVTVDELEASIEPSIEFLRKAPDHTMHNFVDVRYVTRYPFDLRRIARTVKTMEEPNLGDFVLLTKNPMLRLVGQFVSGFGQKNLHVFQEREIDDAMQLLRDLDDALPDDLVDIYNKLISTLPPANK